jgi:uncharacterized protein (TIGR02246 family)
MEVKRRRPPAPFWHGPNSHAKLNYGKQLGKRMTEDESAIRNLIATWIAASKSGDMETVLDLIHDEALFHVPGVKPFGKAAFAAASGHMKDLAFEGESEVLEVEIRGMTAWCRTHLVVTTTPAGGKPVRRSGYTLSILRKTTAGKWQLYRDANLLTIES